jgi:AAA15 family ATPase/GTPase
MLLEFTVGNYLSFKDKQTLSLEATAIKDFPGNVITAGE